MTEQIITLAKMKQSIDDRIKIKELQKELHTTDLPNSLKIEIDLWLQRAYARLQPLKTN